MRLLPIVLLAGCTHPPAALPPPAPFGVAWGMLYGVPEGAPVVFLPELRRLGAGFTRVNLLWSQIEPERGKFDWRTLDALLAQIDRPDEVILTLLSASPWATRTPAWVFPSSPAQHAEDYVHFVRAVAERVHGRVTLFQVESEQNNPFFWAGTAGDYVDELRLFHRAIKEVNPEAVVVLGGSDGLFAPPGAHPIPGQERSLAFTEEVLRTAPDQFDVFDLHLYADPYTIPGRVDMIRQRTTRPIIATEYHGPGFFEVPANRRYFALLGEMAGGGPSSSVAQLYASAETLAPETRMFMADAPPALAARLLRAQMRDLVVRNVLALASGVQRTAFWDMWHDDAPRDAVISLLYGPLRLADRSGERVVARAPLAEAFRRMTTALAGVTTLRRLPTAPDLYAFAGDDGRLVVWHRADAWQDDVPSVMVELPWTQAKAHALDALGETIDAEVAGGVLRIPVAGTPIFVRP